MDDLRKLQLIELDILKVFIAICEKHGFRYYLMAGTLLGAVRHEGFIPWDDDIDVGMPRPDYEKFIRIAEDELNEPYQLHTILNGKGSYGYYYARVENTEVLLQKDATIQKTKIPAWIDVFPLDGVPNDDKEADRWIQKCNFRKKVFALSQASRTAATDTYKKTKGGIKSAFRRVFLTLKLDRLISTKWAWKKLDRTIRSYDYEKCDRIMNVCGIRGRKTIFAKEKYGDGRKYKFEDIYVNGPAEYDFILTQLFGDYMTPPEKNNRDQHHITILKV